MNKKDEYVARLHATIDQLSASLDRAEAKAKSLEQDARERYREAIGALKSRIADLKARARELDRAREDTWDAIKRSIDAGVEEFRRVYQRERDQRQLTELEALPPAGESAGTEVTEQS